MKAAVEQRELNVAGDMGGLEICTGEAAHARACEVEVPEDASAVIEPLDPQPHWPTLCRKLEEPVAQELSGYPLVQSAVAAELVGPEPRLAGRSLGEANRVCPLLHSGREPTGSDDLFRAIHQRSQPRRATRIRPLGCRFRRETTFSEVTALSGMPGFQNVISGPVPPASRGDTRLAVRGRTVHLSLRRSTCGGLGLAIVVEKTNDGYLAQVTPPHGRGTTWSTVEPIALRPLIDQLRALGCHQTDIGGALYRADPEWTTNLEE